MSPGVGKMHRWGIAKKGTPTVGLSPFLIPCFLYPAEEKSVARGSTIFLGKTQSAGKTQRTFLQVQLFQAENHPAGLGLPTVVRRLKEGLPHDFSGFGGRKAGAAPAPRRGPAPGPGAAAQPAGSGRGIFPRRVSVFVFVCFFSRWCLFFFVLFFFGGGGEMFGPQKEETPSSKVASEPTFPFTWARIS